MTVPSSSDLAFSSHPLYTLTMVTFNRNVHRFPADERVISLGRRASMSTQMRPPETVPERPGEASYSLWQLVRYFLKLGTLGFGGPVALVGYMQRDLVEKRGWIAESDYKEGLALAQLSPGPLAAQLAMYLGYVRARILGAPLLGLAFIWPSFLMVVALGWR